MIELKSLILKNFLTFKDKQEIVFPKTGLLLLKGENGSGKSSLLEAISYAFDYCKIPSTELQSWYSEDNLYVKLTLNYNGAECVIEREPGSYVINFEGKKYENKDAGIKAKEIFTQSDFISFITYRPQGELGNFIPLRPGEKQDFLNSLLSLDKLEEIIDVSQEKLKTLDERLIFENQKLEEFKVLNAKQKLELADLTTLIEKHTAEKKVIEASAPIRKTFEDKYEEQIGNLNSLLYLVQTKKIQTPPDNSAEIEALEKLATETKANPPVLNTLDLSDFLKRKSVLEQDLQSFDMKAANIEIKKLVDTIFKTEKEIQSLPEKRIALKNIEEKLTTLHSCVCYTCKQSWVADVALIHDLNQKKSDLEKFISSESDLITTLADFKASHKKIFEQQNAHIARENELNTLVKEMEHKDAQNTLVNKNLIAQHDAKIRSLAEKQVDLLVANARIMEGQKKSHELELKNVELEIDKFLNAIDSEFKQAVAVHQSNLNKVDNQIKIFESHWASKNKDFYLNNSNGAPYALKVKDTQNQINVEKEIVSCLKANFIRLVTDETLNSINQFSNDYLHLIPSTSNFNVMFDIARLNKAGKLKKEINLKLFKDGKEVKRISGGERCSVNLAVDLAISKILSLRGGKDFAWIIFDESLDGLSVKNKKFALQLIKELSKNKLIMMIEHTADIAEMFDKVIEVKNGPTGSYLEN